MELTLADLTMRDLDAIEERTRLLRSSEAVSDESLLASLSVDDNEVGNDAVGPLGPVALLLSENSLSAVSSALFAIEVGDRELLANALEELALGERASSDVSAPGPWWVYRLTRRMLGDLFNPGVGAQPSGRPANRR